MIEIKEVDVNLPKFGLHLPSALSPMENVRLAVKAESSGLDSVWLSEDLYFYGAIPTIAAVAVATKRILLGFGVLTPYNRHPSLVAMEAATLLALAGPRVVLGFGAGVKVRVERTAVEYRQPLRAVSEMVSIVREMLAGDMVDLDGVVHGADQLLLDVPPTELPPIYLASTGEKSLRQSGRIGDGLVLTVMSSLEHARWAIRTAREGAAEAGRSLDIPTVVYLPLSVDDNPAVARQRLKPMVAYYIGRWARIPALSRLFIEWGPLSPNEVIALADALEAGGDSRELIDDALVDAYCIAGSPKQCIDRLAAYGSAGVTTVAFDHGRGGPNADRVIADLTRLLALDARS